MYEKTIAAENKIFKITTIANTSTLIYDLFSAQDKAEYDALLTLGVSVQPLLYASINNDKIIPRTPIDGYIICQNADLFVSTSINGATDLCVFGTQYTFPVYFWPHKFYIRSAYASECIVRIFFS